jgi:hypothetical protein
MYNRPNYLFEGTSAYSIAQDIQIRAMNQLKTRSENEILNTPTDDLVADLLSACNYSPPGRHHPDRIIGTPASAARRASRAVSPCKRPVAITLAAAA